MLEKTFDLFFYLKHAKNQKDGLRYVYLRITVDGKPVEMSTKQLWSPARWNVDAGRAIGQKEDTRTLNAYLDMLSSKVFPAKKMLIEDDKELSAEALKNVLLGKSNETRTILEVFSAIMSKWKPWLGKSSLRSP